MTIGINVTAISKEPRTGVEEYVYGLVKHLAGLEESGGHRFLLYTQSKRGFDFSLPHNFRIKELKWRLPMWTQIRLSGELFFDKMDILFIPVHVLPLIHPKKSVVAIQGLEYEYFPACYSKKQLHYLRFITKHAAREATEIVVPSKSTKDDLVKFYKIEPERITVIHYGVEPPVYAKIGAENFKNTPYILYIGRLETKKNLINLVKAFDLFKRKHKTAHKLVLAGFPGYGYKDLKFEIRKLSSGSDIVETGYVSLEKKWQLYRNADLFAFVSFYEGFGFPVLEAQATSCPVIASNVSSLPEVAGGGAVLVNPSDIEEIAESMYKVISQRDFKQALIDQGHENVKDFSWQNCAQKTLRKLIK